MRALALLFALAAAGCGPSEVSAEWSAAEVISSDRAIAIHGLWPTARVKAQIVNRSDSTVTFHLTGKADGYGQFIGPDPDAPARFLLVGPDTTLPMVASPWESRRIPRGFRESVKPGDTLAVSLWADSAWLFPFDRPISSFAPDDSTSSADFYSRALNEGRIVYVTASADTLAVPRSKDAVVYFRAEDQPSALN